MGGHDVQCEHCGRRIYEIITKRDPYPARRDERLRDGRVRVRSSGRRWSRVLHTCAPETAVVEAGLLPGAQTA